MIETIYEIAEWRAMARHKSNCHTCQAKGFAGVFLRGGERHLVAKYFWTERKHSGCDRAKLKRFASRFA